jgi:hypothetical protein
MMTRVLQLLAADIQAAYRCHVNPRHAEIGPMRNGFDTNNRYDAGKDTTGMS